MKPKENSTRWKTLRDKTTCRLEFCAASGLALREAAQGATARFQGLLSGNPWRIQ